LFVLGCECLGLAAAAGNLVADGVSGALVAQVSLLCAATSVVERYALNRSLSVLNLGATAVTDHHCFLRHRNPPKEGYTTNQTSKP
jgi:hypothetical protein